MLVIIHNLTFHNYKKEFVNIEMIFYVYVYFYTNDYICIYQKNQKK